MNEKSENTEKSLTETTIVPALYGLSSAAVAIIGPSLVNYLTTSSSKYFYPDSSSKIGDYAGKLSGMVIFPAALGSCIYNLEVLFLGNSWSNESTNKELREYPSLAYYLAHYATIVTAPTLLVVNYFAEKHNYYDGKNIQQKIHDGVMLAEGAYFTASITTFGLANLPACLITGIAVGAFAAPSLITLQTGYVLGSDISPAKEVVETIGELVNAVQLVMG